MQNWRLNQMPNPKVLTTPSEGKIEFVNDDGISNRIEGGLSLRVETEAVGKSGSWKVYAKIV